MTSISLQSVAHNSHALLDRLGDPANGATIEKGRFGINDKGQLVVFKGKTFLLHLQQCFRADKLVKANDLSTQSKPSLLGTFKFKDLRLGTQPANQLIRAMNVSNALKQVVGAPVVTVSPSSPFKNILNEALLKAGFRPPEPKARVHITTQPPMQMTDLPWARSISSSADDPSVLDTDGDSGVGVDFGYDAGFDADSSISTQQLKMQTDNLLQAYVEMKREHDSNVEIENPFFRPDANAQAIDTQTPALSAERPPLPKPRTRLPPNALPKAPRTFTSPLSPNPLPGSVSPSTLSSHSFEFIPGTPPGTATSEAAGTATPLPTATSSGDTQADTGSANDGPAFLGDLHRGGMAKDGLIRMMLANRQS